MIFLVEKIGEALMQKFLTFFQQKILELDINVGNFNKTLTNDVVSFEQPGPDQLRATKMLILQAFT